MVDDVDVLEKVKTLLSNNWNAANTDSITPLFLTISEHKQLDAANNDFILVYESNETIDPFDIGGNNWAHERRVSLDIRTTYKKAKITDIRPHLIKIQGEVNRIIKSNLRNPDGTHHQLKLISQVDRSDKHSGIGRKIIEVMYQYWGN